MSITRRAKKAIKNIGKYRTEQQVLESVNYSPSYAKSGHIKETQGWQELMEKNLPDKDLLKTHKEGLKAKKENEFPDFANRHKYLETGYKIKGKFPKSEIGVGVGVQININEDREKYGK